jgi:iron complex transport system ATP-binding protein
MTPAAAPAAGVPFDAALRTRDLAVGYRTRKRARAVLEHVNLAVDSGELVCLLGPNGIGKSTLLRTIARMQPALWGTVELGGTDLRTVSQAELARRLGVVLTERVAVEALTVRRIVGLGRYPHSGWFGGLTDRDRVAVDWAIDAVGARHLADRDFSRLSDGERQRVMIARALAQEPVLLVLDEPTAFLDVPSRVELMGLLRQLTRERPLAVVVSTHDLELALRTADVIWLAMPGGGLVTGAPEDVVLSGGIDRRSLTPDSLPPRGAQPGFTGSATWRVHGQSRALAAAALERVATRLWRRRDLARSVRHAHDTGWRLWTGNGECSGADFASLADTCAKENQVMSISTMRGDGERRARAVTVSASARPRPTDDRRAESVGFAR